MNDTAFRPTRVLELELGQPLEDLTGLRGYGALLALVRFHGVPIGFVRLPIASDSCAASALASAVVEQLGNAVVYHLVADGLGQWPVGREALPRLFRLPHPVEALALPTATVAVCTRGRPELLAGCLAAIDRLDYPELERLVVDNAPPDQATERLVREGFPRVRYAVEPRIGLDWARNRALHEARGELLAYTDDDALPDPGWLRAAARPFVEDASVAAVTGLVAPFELETEAQELFERNGGFGQGFVRRRHRVAVGELASARHGTIGSFGTGANMVFRRGVLADLGGFDVALDVGTPTNGGGDLEIFFRVLKSGYTLVYEPAALVWHRHRRELAALERQMEGDGSGFAAALLRSAAAYPEERRGLARVARWWLLHWLLRRLVASYAHPPRFLRRLLLAEWRGARTALGRYRRSRRAAAAGTSR